MEIKMPKLGLTMSEGTLSHWLVQEGDRVKQGDILFEFESDKSTMEFEAPMDGTLGRLLVEEGETVLCGEAVATLEGVNTTKKLATPAAKRRARELGISLAVVEGRGVNGRIQLVDIEESSQADRVKKQSAKASPVARRLANELGIDIADILTESGRERITRQDVVAAVRGRQITTKVLDLPQVSEIDVAFRSKTKLAGVRRAIAKHMSDSALSAPQVTLHTEVDAGNLMMAHSSLNDRFDSKFKISFNALFIAFAGKILSAFPQMNACLLEDEICQYKEVNVGLAVETPRGLLVPVIRKADQLSVAEIQQECDSLIARALAGKNEPDDLNAGTFTITNLGMFGVDAFTPIINQPQAGILGVGRIITKPANHNGEMALRDRLTLSLTFDHRLIDGVPAAQFLQQFGQLVEQPLAMIL